MTPLKRGAQCLMPCGQARADRALFTATAAPGQVARPAPTWPEPHGSWVDPLDREWTRRYGQA